MSTAISSRWGTHIPGPTPIPLLGILPTVLRFGFQPLATMEALLHDYGKLVRLGWAKYPVVMVFDPEYNRQILRDPASFYAYDLDLVPLDFPKDSPIRRTTTGMPLMNGDRHNDHRSALLPFFHKKIITRYHAACVEVTERKMTQWKPGAQLDIRAEMEQLAMWLATVPVLGLDPEQEGEAIGMQLESTMKVLFNPFALMFPYDIPGFPFHVLMRHAVKMERIVREVIARKRIEGLKGDDILSIMIKMHDEDPERLNENELIGHTTTMFRGGYNPNGMALYWTIFLLSQHPQAMQKVLQELKQETCGQSPTSEAVEKLPYLEGAIKEAMRLFPAGTWTGRLAMKDFVLDSHSLPEGTWIVMSPYITHRLPEVFPDPYKFKPERWLSEYHSAYEFMPFSGGPRYCIGTSLGMMQLKIALAILLQRYSFTLNTKKVDCGGLNSIRPHKGLPMVLGEAGIPPKQQSLKGNIHRIVEFDR
jgi:cytochrome P450